MNHRPLLSKAVFLPLLFAVCGINSATAEKSAALFRYAAELRVPDIDSTQLAELTLTARMHAVLRNDFADLRIIENRNDGAVPVRISQKTEPLIKVPLLVERDFTLASDVPAELVARYADSSFISFQTCPVPLSRVYLDVEPDGSPCNYIFMAKGVEHAAGAEWRLIARGKLTAPVDGMQPDGAVLIDFPESRSEQYTFVFDQTDFATYCKVISVSGAEYAAYFKIEPDSDYTLLCGYSSISSVSGFAAAELDRLISSDQAPIGVTVGELVENCRWNIHTIKSLVFQRAFLVPLSVAAVLITALLIFFALYSLSHRKRPFKMRNQPRFFK